MSLSKLLKSNLIWIVLVVVATSLVIGWILLFYHPYGHYERNIQRDIDNEEEAQVLEVVENFDYSGTLGIARYYHDDWANFIDSQVIEHYNSEYESMREEETNHNVYLNYTAKVLKEQDLNIRYNYVQGEIIEGHSNEEVETIGDEYELELDSINGTIFRLSGEDIFPAIIIEFPQEEQDNIDHEFDFERNFTNVYVVNQFLYYGDTWGPVAGYSVRIHQIIILNENFQPLFIMIDAQQVIS